MNFHILTLFPEMIEQGLNTSITGRAISNGLLSIEAINIRDYAFNKHQSVDDYPYGGGAGMLMQAEPVYLAYEAVRKKIAERKPAEAETEEPAEAEQLEEKPVTGSEEEPVKESSGSFIFLHREMCSAREWRRNLQRKKTWCFYADIMKELMNGYWKKS